MIRTPANTELAADPVCPGPHPGPVPAPEARRMVAGTAVCEDCGTVSQICPQKGCGGRTRAGGAYCRACGRPLPDGWRRRAWKQLGQGQHLGPATIARTLDESELPDAVQVRLVASDAWLALCLDRRVLLLEPGPQLRTFAEATLVPDEILFDLRVEREAGEIVWQMLTTHRQLRFEPSSHSWEEVESLPHQLLWESRGLRAYLLPEGGTALQAGAAAEALPTTPNLLTSPAWLAHDRFVCQDQDAVYLGSMHSGEPPSRFAAPKPLAAYPPLVDQRSQTVYLPGQGTVYTWEPGRKTFVPFLPAAGGPVLPSPEGIAVLESDRLRLVSRDGRVLWDSRSEMPSFFRATAEWDRAGDTLLVPLATRGVGIQLLLADLAQPGRYLRTELAAGLLADPRLTPGGIIAARRDAPKAPLELAWIGFQREDE